MSDFIEQPVSAAGVGDVIRAVGEQDFAHEAMAILVLGSGELVQIIDRERRGIRDVEYDGFSFSNELH